MAVWDSFMDKWDYVKNPPPQSGQTVKTPEESEEDKDRKAKQAAAEKVIEEMTAAWGKAEELAAEYTPHLDTLQEDIQSAPGEFAAAGAQALAPVYGQFGMGGAASSPAAALAGSQVSIDAQRAASAQLRQLNEDLANGKLSQKEAEIAAHQLGVATQEAIMAKPTGKDFKADQIADLEAEWNRLVAGNTGGAFYNDDEEAIFKGMHVFLSKISDEELRDTYYRRACSIIDANDWGAHICDQLGYDLDTLNV